MRRRIIRPFRCGLLLLALGGLTEVAAAQVSAGLADLVAPGAAERITSGYIFTEGPVWHPSGYLLFSDINRNSIYKWTADGQVTVFRSPSDDSNGLALDREGRLISCEQTGRKVSRMDQDGAIVTLASTWEGKKLNCPNDVVVRSDGSIYFTDPPYGLTGIKELAFQGVYRITPDGKTLELLVNDIQWPNGLAFSPDEKVLYIADCDGMKVYAFDVLENGDLANRRIFATMFGFPDGMKVDVRGNLYVTTNTYAIRVFDSTGEHLGDIPVPEATTNCAFGGPDYRTLFITAGKSVYRVQMKVQGDSSISNSLSHPRQPRRSFGKFDR